MSGIEMLVVTRPPYLININGSAPSQVAFENER